MNKIIILGSLKPERKIQDNYLVYGGGGICPTLRARDYKDPKKVVVKNEKVLQLPDSTRMEQRNCEKF